KDDLMRQGNRMLRYAAVALMIAASLCVAQGAEPRAAGKGAQGEPSPHEKEIRALIEKLAISDKPADRNPVGTPGRDAPADDKRVIAFRAYNKLRDFGVEAFPYLIESLDDKRQSACFMRAVPCSVGLACYSILRDQLFAAPPD